MEGRFILKGVHRGVAGLGCMNVGVGEGGWEMAGWGVGRGGGLGMGSGALSNSMGIGPCDWAMLCHGPALPGSVIISH